MATRKNFSELTAAGKRARVARDVIARLDAEEIFAGRGYGKVLTAEQIPLEGDLQDILSAEGSQCEACALGCMFLADVISRDRMSVRKSIGWDSEQFDDFDPEIKQISLDDDTIRARLGAFFGVRQLAMIESAYEMLDFRNSNGGHHATSYEDIEAAIEFGSNFSKDEDRLRAIMQNIVDHRGNFVP